MVLLNPHPVPFILPYGFLHLMVRRGLPPLHQISNIDLIFQNTPHRHRAPPGRRLHPERRPEIDTPAVLILHRRKDTVPIQLPGNGILAHAVQLHTENIPHHPGRISINHKPMAVLTVLLIPIRRKSADKLPVPPLHFQMAPDLHRNIPAVSVIDQVLKRNQNLVPLPVPSQTVIMVIHRNKAHPKSREQPLNIASRINVLTPEPRQILDDHTVHRAPPYILQHLLEPRPLKTGTAVPVVHPFRNHHNILFVLQEISD